MDFLNISIKIITVLMLTGITKAEVVDLDPTGANHAKIYFKFAKEICFVEDSVSFYN